MTNDSSWEKEFVDEHVEVVDSSFELLYGWFQKESTLVQGTMSIGQNS